MRALRLYRLGLLLVGLLAGVSAAVAQAPKPPTPEQAAAEVVKVFRKHCFECHGGTQTSAGVKILDRDKLVEKKKIVPGKVEASRLFQRVVEPKDDARMPPEELPRLNQQEVDAIGFWIAAGAPPLPLENPPKTTEATAEEKLNRPAAPVFGKGANDRPLEELKPAEVAAAEKPGVEYVLNKILEDVTKVVPEKDRPFVRYFSLNHLLNLPPDELDAHRLALGKALNSLSWEKDIVRPQPIEPTKTVFRVDLRNYGLDRRPFKKLERRVVNGRQGPLQEVGGSPLSLFDLVLLEYPYARTYATSEAYDNLLEEFLKAAGQVVPVPFVRGDWFASTATQPPLYYDLLQLPRTLKRQGDNPGLEDILGVDAPANVASGAARRAGMSVSGVSQHNRAVERHPTDFGGYWKSHDYRSSKEEASLFRDPVNLKPAGGEMIFSLPNGLQGYFITDAAGNRQDFAPTDIVTDKFAADKTVRAGLSCMRCHQNGILAFTDRVRPAVEDMVAEPDFDLAHVRRLYAPQGEMDRLLKEDTDRFLTALKQLAEPLPEKEPLQIVSQRFLYGPVRSTDVDGELGHPGHLLQKAMFTPPFLRQGLGALASDGEVRRDQWESGQSRVLSALKVGLAMPPLDAVGGQDFLPEDEVDIQFRALRVGGKDAVDLFAPGDELVLEVTNRSKRPLNVELLAAGSQGGKAVLTGSQPVLLNPGQTFRFPNQGGIRIPARLSKKRQVYTVLAGEAPLPRVELLRGPQLADRIIHPFHELERRDGKVRLKFEATRLLKKSLEVEVR